MANSSRILYGVPEIPRFEIPYCASYNTPVKSGVCNILTVDVEEYFQVENFRGVVLESQWEGISGRSERSTLSVLDLLEACGVRATFFVLGWVADRYPRLVRAIADRGHELASHGYRHRPVYEMTPGEFREDIRKSRNSLGAAAGVEVTGYRAPTFSIVERTLWALDVLAEEGFQFDSSIFPVRHHRYGIPTASRFIHRVRTGCGREILELPPMTVRLLGFNVPMGGGAYLRLLPVQAFVSAMRRFNSAGEPVTIYLHPWELDPAQPRLPGAVTARFRHYHNLHFTAGKLKRLLSAGRFGPVSTALAEMSRRR